MRKGQLLVVVGAFVSCIASADTISWWRFEVDTDPSATGLVNPNTIGSEPSMVSSNGRLEGDVPNEDLFDTVIPRTGDVNTASVRSAINGGGDDGIYGSAAYSSTLDVDSITVEFWMRTTESTAGFVARTTDPDDAGESGTLDDGFRIVDPNNVRVNFFTGTSSSGTQRTINSGVSVNDGEWHYIAFTYDSASGLAQLYVDDQVFSNTGSQAGDVMYWGGASATPTVTIGYQMDGNPGNDIGTLDEIRFSDVALAEEDLLRSTPIIPEPRTVAMGVLALLTGLGLQFRRWQKRHRP